MNSTGRNPAQVGPLRAEARPRARTRARRGVFATGPL
jgi:hypothetical protein